MAAIYDRFMERSEQACLRAWRRELLSDLRGDVLEIGAGTGANLPYYGRGVTRLIAVEPDPHMRRRLEGRARSGYALECRDGRAETLPAENESVDAVVSTLVLCSVRDPVAVLEEVRRVLRRGGTFVFLEHVAAAPESKRRKWQGRIEPFWKLVADGCHLTRETEVAIERAGFRIETVERESMRKALPWVRPTIRGRATSGAA